MERFLDQVLQERHNHDAFERVLVDVERFPRVAESYAVSVLPTILVVDRGHETCRLEGVSSVSVLRSALAPWLR